MKCWNVRPLPYIEFTYGSVEHTPKEFGAREDYEQWRFPPGGWNVSLESWIVLPKDLGHEKTSNRCYFDGIGPKEGKLTKYHEVPCRCTAIMNGWTIPLLPYLPFIYGSVGRTLKGFGLREDYKLMLFRSIWAERSRIDQTQ